MNSSTLFPTNGLQSNASSSIFSIKEPDISDLASIGMFLAYLAVGFFIVFVMIGLCIISHTVYMKYFKKPWSEKPSKSIWFIEIEKKKENLSTRLRNNLSRRQTLNNKEDDNEDSDSDGSSSDHVSLKNDIQNLNTNKLNENDYSNVNKAYIQSVCDLSVVVKDNENLVEKL